MNPGRHKIYHHSVFVFALILAVIGLFNLYSATFVFEAGQASPYFAAQLFYTLLGVVVMFAVSRLSLKHLYVWSPLFYAASLLLLVLVLMVGARMHGSLSWLDLGFVRLQPAEFGKVGLVLILSRYLSQLPSEKDLNLKTIIAPLILFLLPAALVIMQNDLGSSLFYGFIFGTVVFVHGVRLRLVFVVVVLLCLAGLLSYEFALKPYQKDRIVSFLNPEHDHRGSGYHLVQSKIAVGSGKIFGRGYLKGQSHRLKFLPERHTDFVFPVLLEEWGFAGGALTLLLYFLFLVSGINIAAKSETRFGYFIAVGCVGLFFWHLVINLGGVLGLIPLTGVTLPFFSYGGSSLLANWLAIGCLLSAARR
ncbi:MAG: rod shape-determining protein RodA [Deltaproteobacteria bacterium]|nr:rod shape-determining protein RodA [Deltaproteobacteria bacterium]